MSQHKKIFIVKTFPETHNPLLYRQPFMSLEGFQMLHIDMRLHGLCVGLMQVDPRLRFGHTEVIEDPNYVSLSNDSFTTQQIIFRWNYFLRHPKEPRCFQLVREYRQTGPAEAPQLKKGRAVPLVPAFPLVTASPGLIGSPNVPSPPGPSQPSAPKSPPKQLPKGMKRCPVARRSPPQGARAW